jgi:predicted Zn-dependent peptidase
MQSRSAYLNQIARYALYGLDPDLVDQYPSRIKSISVDDLKSVAKKYFTPERRATGVVRGQGDPAAGR